MMENKTFVAYIERSSVRQKKTWVESQKIVCRESGVNSNRAKR